MSVWWTVSAISVCKVIVTICGRHFTLSVFLCLSSPLGLRKGMFIFSLSVANLYKDYKTFYPPNLEWKEILDSSRFLLPSFYQLQHNWLGNKLGWYQRSSPPHLGCTLFVHLPYPFTRMKCGQVPLRSLTNPVGIASLQRQGGPKGSDGGIREIWWAARTASSLGWATFLMSGALRRELLPLDQSWKLEIWPSVNNFEINLIQFCSLPANFVYLSHTFKERKPSLKKCGISSYLLISDQVYQNLPLPGVGVSAVQ